MTIASDPSATGFSIPAPIEPMLAKLADALPQGRRGQLEVTAPYELNKVFGAGTKRRA